MDNWRCYSECAVQNNPLLILGQTTYRNERKRFGIKLEDRRRPTVILGKTGMGKSTLLLNCIVQDIQRGNGVVVIDPHGDLIERVLATIPARRINETVYFNPADTEHPIGFNPLHNADPRQRHLVASGIIQAFKKIWVDFWGPRLEYVLRNALLALIESPGNTLLGIPRLLTDDQYRIRVLKGVNDPVIRQFWTTEYEQYPKVFRTETISPIQNKVGQFLANPLTRNILGQTKTNFNLLDVMDSGKIMLVNLAKGSIGEDAASLLGALMVTQLYVSSLRRVRSTEDQRRDVYVYIDEAHFVQTDEFATILSEARKYRLNIAGMANQFLTQFPPSMVSAILGNAGTLIAFACGSEDAEILAREFFPLFSASDLQNLSQREMYIRLSIDGKTSVPFSAEALTWKEPTFPPNRDAIVTQSRQRYCKRRIQIAKDISSWIQPSG